MKRLLCILMSALMVSALCAQDKPLFSKKDAFKDFTAKTTKIVLAQDNSLLDLMLKDAIDKNWTISPYEFCSMEEFEKIKSDTSYYFLVRVNGKLKKENEPSMEYISLLKGGEGAEKGLSNMPDIISIPLQPIDDNEGRVFTYLPAFIRIIQNHVIQINSSIFSAYIGIAAYADKMNGVNDKTILFEENDFAFQVPQEKLEKDFKGKAKIVSQSEIDKALETKAPNTLVSLVIAPNIEQKGSFCYKMLISTDSEELYLYRKLKLGGKNKKGFTTEDYKRIAAPYAY